MNDKNITNRMENMSKPNVSLPKHEERLRITYVNAKKSAWWGVILITLPTIFVLYNVLKHVIGLESLPDISTFIPSRILNDIFPFLFIGGGLTAIILNLLAVLHFEFNNESRAWSLAISLKKKKWNLIILSIALVSMGILFSYLLIENWQCILGIAESC